MIKWKYKLLYMDVVIQYICYFKEEFRSTHFLTLIISQNESTERWGLKLNRFITHVRYNCFSRYLFIISCVCTSWSLAKQDSTHDFIQSLLWAAAHLGHKTLRGWRISTSDKNKRFTIDRVDSGWSYGRKLKQTNHSFWDIITSD